MSLLACTGCRNPNESVRQELPRGPTGSEAFYAETGAAPGTAPDDLQHGGP